MTVKPIALVTGAAQGIGLACAEALLEQDVFVVLSDINARGVEAAALRLGPGADFVICDMSDSDAISTMFELCRSRSLSSLGGRPLYRKRGPHGQRL